MKGKKSKIANTPFFTLEAIKTNSTTPKSFLIKLFIKDEISSSWL